MRWVSAFLVAALVAGLAGVGLAAEGRIVELAPRRDGGWLSVDLRATDLLDARTRSTVESGLPGSCELRLVLEREGRGAVAHRSVRRQLELDLWEEVVWLRGEEVERSFSSLAAADSAWSRFRGLRLKAWSELVADARYRVVARLEVRPLGADERAEMSRWVSRREDQDRRETSFDLGGLLHHFVGGASGREEGLVRRTDFFRPAEIRLREEAP